MSIKVGTEKIDGKSFDIHVDSIGRFVAEWEGEEYTAETKAALIEELTKELRRAASRISIPLTRVEKSWRDSSRIEIQDVIVTGIHRRTNNVLYRPADGSKGKAGQASRHSGEFVQRLTAEQKKQLKALKAAVHAAEKELEKFEKSIEVDVPELIEEAVKQAHGGK